MKHEQIAKCLSELGHPTRLAIYRELVRNCSGLPVGEIQKTLKIPGSTLSHHISRLVNANLVEQRREGCMLYCQCVCETLNNVLKYLKVECCR